MADLWSVHCKVNGKYVEVKVPPLTSLVELLRDYLNLKGTKIGCNEGECGACTVLMNGKPVNSCMVLAPQAEGAEIWTIEGITPQEGLHPLQEAFLDVGAVQCGYCTPGFIVAGSALLRENPHPTREQILEGIEGNLCRCTGYQKIIDAIERCANQQVDREDVKG